VQITASQHKRLARYRHSERWTGQTIADALVGQCRIRHGKVAVIDGGETLTFAALKSRALQVAGALQLRGIKSGDVISLQLPNWHETVVFVIAATMIGAVINPIVPIYREAEVAFILSDSNSRLLIIPSSFRNFDYGAMVARITEQNRHVPPVIIIRESQWVAGGRAANVFKTDIAPESGDPNGVRLLMYTSGTTGRAKGVLHSTNTLAAEISAVTEYWNVTCDDVVLMPSPLTHVTGFLYGIDLPIRSGCAVVLMDKWAAAEAADLIQRHNVTMMVGATPFLAELVAYAEAQGLVFPSLRLFACGGAPVPPQLIYKAHKIFAKCVVTRVYGSTEAPTVTLGVTSREREWFAAETDGSIVGHEVKIVEPGTGLELAKDLEGEIATRGPELFLGYLNPDDERGAFTADGFFLTGDLGRFVDKSSLVITGRKKDLIIRGGEKIAPKEIEDVLFTHAAVAEVAVVAIPSQRLGEGVGAFIIIRSGMYVDSAQLQEHVVSHGLAIQKCPERFFFVPELPKTASGKIRKDLLRQKATELIETKAIV
jgi:acyl-CoA synthetase (AMP-forming)/AMP-acid ligase II